MDFAGGAGVYHPLVYQHRFGTAMKVDSLCLFVGQGGGVGFDGFDVGGKVAAQRIVAVALLLVAEEAVD